MRSITITPCVHRSHTISGTSTRSRPCMLRRSCAALAASRTRSSSSCRYLSNSATTSRGFRRLAVGRQPLDPARHGAHQREVVVDRRQHARPQHLHRDLAAVFQHREVHLRDRGARHRLGLEAGEHRIDRAAEARARPAARAIAAGNGGTRSCSLASSSAMSGGSRSRRVDSTCPNLTKIGPRRSRPSRSRSPRGASSRRPTVITRTSRRTERWRKLDSASSSSP